MSFFKEFLGKFPSSFTTRLNSNNWKLSKYYTSGLDDAKGTLKKLIGIEALIMLKAKP